MKPVSPPCIENIPAELRTVLQWVTWRYEPRNPGEDPTKVPYNPHKGYRARVSNKAGKTYSNRPADTWSTFEVAVNAYRAGRNHDGESYHGIAFVFVEGGGFAGLDLDHCVDPATGIIAEWAMFYINLLDSYSEFSPSGAGVKIVVKAKKPGPRCRTAQHPGFEFYDGARLFTLTGNRVPGTPATVNERQEQYAQAWGQIFPPEPKVEHSKQGPVGGVPQGDEQLLERIRGSQQGPLFRALFDCGDLSEYAGDDSAADMALACSLAFWTQKDAARMDRLHRMSALYREKWERTDYRERTIERAIERTTNVYDPNQNRYQPRQSDPEAEADAAEPPDLEAPEESDPAEEIVAEETGETEEAGTPSDTEIPHTEPPAATTNTDLLNELHQLDRKLQRKGVKVLACGLMMPPDMDREDVETVGRLLKYSNDRVQVWLNFRWGDWYRLLPTQRGVRGNILARMYGNGPKLMNEQDRLRGFAKVAAKIPDSKRRLDRSWSFYEVLSQMSPARQDYWLQQKLRKGMLADMKAEVQAAQVPARPSQQPAQQGQKAAAPPQSPVSVSTSAASQPSPSLSVSINRGSGLTLENDMSGPMADISGMTPGTITIDISVEMAEKMVTLKQQAIAAGMSVEAYLGRLLERGLMAESGHSAAVSVTLKNDGEKQVDIRSKQVDVSRKIYPVTSTCLSTNLDSDVSTPEADLPGDRIVPIPQSAEPDLTPRLATVNTGPTPAPPLSFPWSNLAPEDVEIVFLENDEEVSAVAR